MVANQSVTLLRPSTRHAYVILTASKKFSSSNGEFRTSERVKKEVTRNHYTVFIADPRLSTMPITDLLCNEELYAQWQHDYKRLQRGDFGSVWFYGDTTSEFTRDTAWSCAALGLRLVNFSERESLLDLFLRHWVRRVSAPP